MFDWVEIEKEGLAAEGRANDAELNTKHYNTRGGGLSILRCYGYCVRMRWQDVGGAGVRAGKERTFVFVSDFQLPRPGFCPRVGT